MYRAPSGALVFGAGTVQWSWGLDDRSGGATDRNMQQATVNLFADMGAQPAAHVRPDRRHRVDRHHRADLDDHVAGRGATVGDGAKITISGTASDTGGVVAGVEVSTDGGTTWHPATGTTSWTYTWIAHGNPSTTIKSRAVDDSGNLETPSAGHRGQRRLPVLDLGHRQYPRPSDSGSPPRSRSASSSSPTSSAASPASASTRPARTPARTSAACGRRRDAAGVGDLHQRDGLRLADGHVRQPRVDHANTTYIASYYAPAGTRPRTTPTCTRTPRRRRAPTAASTPAPARAAQHQRHGERGLQEQRHEHVPDRQPERAELLGRRDVRREQRAGDRAGSSDRRDRHPGQRLGEGDLDRAVGRRQRDHGLHGHPVHRHDRADADHGDRQPAGASATVTGLTNGTTYTFKVTATNAVGTGPASAASNAVTPGGHQLRRVHDLAVVGDAVDPDEGTRPRSRSGSSSRPTSTARSRHPVLQGRRQHRHPHREPVDVAGTKLATATFSNETASGWQQVTFASPVAITAGTIYVASYFAPVGHYAGDGGYFAASGVDNPPLHALRTGSAAATASTRTAPPAPSPPARSTPRTTGSTSCSPRGRRHRSRGSDQRDARRRRRIGGGVVDRAVERRQPITSYTVTPFIGTTAQTPTTVTGSPPATTATVTGLTNGTAYTFTVSATNAIGHRPRLGRVQRGHPDRVATAPAAPTGVTRDRRERVGGRDLDRAVERRQRDHQLHGDPVHRHDRADPDDGDRQPAGDHGDGDRADQRHGLHVQGVRDQRGGHRPGVGRLQRGHPDGDADGACGSDECDRDGRGRVGGGDVDRAVQRRQPDHQLHGHPVRRDDGADADHGDRQPAGDHGDGDRADQRHGVHVHGVRDQRGGHWPGFGRLQRGHPDGDADRACGSDERERDGRGRVGGGDVDRAVGWRSPITSYTVTPYVGTTAQTPTTVTGSPPATTATVTGLTNGTAYTFTVAATNAVGTGPASAASNAVTPTASVPGAPTSVSATAGDTSAVVSWTAPSDGGSPITSYTVTPYVGTTGQTPTTVTGSPPDASATVTGLTNGTAYTFKVTATNAVGTGPASAASNAVTPTATGCSACTIWPSSATPTSSDPDTSSVELGVKFKADVNGSITGIRFYKGTANTGTHIGSLWTATGTKLATATFTNETASGWQQVTFASPVAITAGTVYVASYLAAGGPLRRGQRLLRRLRGRQRAAARAAGRGQRRQRRLRLQRHKHLPQQHLQRHQLLGRRRLRYRAGDRPAAPTDVSATAGDASAVVSWTAPSDGGSPITSYTVTPYIGTTAQTPTTVTGSPPDDHGDGDRADHRHRLHVQGHCHERGRHRPRPRPPPTRSPRRHRLHGVHDLAVVGDTGDGSVPTPRRSRSA